jgi:hypothetical protein
MPLFIISDSLNTLLVDEKECIALELNLNVTSKGRLWKTIGDELFAFGTYQKEAKARLAVTTEQLTFLKDIQHKTRDVCKLL